MAEIKKIDIQQVQKLLETENALLVDVRESNEFNSSHIPLAVSIPLSQLDDYLADLKEQNRPVIFQCQSGVRSQKAAEKMATHLVEEQTIYTMIGGIAAWQQANLPIISPNKKKTISMPRQVMIAAGSLNILFSLISFKSPIGSALTLFLGCGLLFAGITGICAMARLLQKMPWNK